MKQLKLILITLSIAALLTSCFTSNNVIKPTYKTKKPKQITLKKLQSKVEDSYLKYDYLQIKFSMKVLLEEKDYALKGQINLSHATNIPVARIIMTSDSLLFMNKIASEYYYGDYSYIDRLFQIELSYPQIQALLTDEIFTYPDWDDVYDLKKGGYKDKIDSCYYCFKSLKDRKVKRMIKKDIEDDLIVQNIFIEPDSFKIENVYIYEYNMDRALNIMYGDFNYIDSCLFPNLMNISLEADSVNTAINIKYERIDIEKELSFSSKIPEKYKRIL